MALWTPDLLVELTLLPTTEGGRSGATPSTWFACPVLLAPGEYFDARFDLTGVGSILPGQVAQVPVKFLFPERAMPLVSAGQVVSLWEGRTIGHAKVLSIHGGA